MFFALCILQLAGAHLWAPANFYNGWLIKFIWTRFNCPLHVLNLIQLLKSLRKRS